MPFWLLNFIVFTIPAVNYCTWEAFQAFKSSRLLSIAWTIGTYFTPFPSSDNLVHASSCFVNNKDFIAMIIIHLWKLEQVWCAQQKVQVEEPSYVSKKQTWILCVVIIWVNLFKWIVLNYMITNIYVNRYCERLKHKAAIKASCHWIPY